MTLASSTDQHTAPDAAAGGCAWLDDLPEAILVLPDPATVAFDPLGQTGSPLPISIIYANHAMARLAGVKDRRELIGTPVLQWFGLDLAKYWSRRAGGVGSVAVSEERLELPLYRVGGEAWEVEVAMSSSPPAGEGNRWLLWSLRDISLQKMMDQKVRLQASHDALTGLPNRALFLDRLGQELHRASRAHRHVALMFIDLDRFKWVNDTLGHAAGDALLQEAAKRLLSCHRKSDTVARLGGDEFTVILPDIAKGPHAERVARSILDQLAKPFWLSGQEAFISGSIGITVFPDDADDVPTLLRNADNAMYRAKGDGRNTYRFFTPDMHVAAMERVALEKDLNHAVARGDLEVYFQPIVDLVSGRVVGAESFLRWRHAVRGLVPPKLFVPLAEEIGLIATIAEETLRTACRQAVVWRHRPGWEEFFITVNLSCTRCRDLSTGDKIQGILEETGLPPHALVLEITENLLIEDEAKALAMLHQLREQGVGLWLDDFGSGYSSLRFLQTVPVTGIKIEQTFVRAACTKREAAVLVEIILSLAGSLGLEVVGEGVETEEQKQFLASRGCRLVQGYLFGHPVSQLEFEAMVGLGV